MYIQENIVMILHHLHSERLMNEKALRVMYDSQGHSMRFLGATGEKCNIIK